MSTLILTKKIESTQLSKKLNSFFTLLQLWLDRYNQRKLLAQLNSRQLADMGISDEQLAIEITKPFWR